MRDQPLDYFAPAPGKPPQSRAGVASFVLGCVGWASVAAAYALEVRRLEAERQRGLSDRDMYLVGFVLLAAGATVVGLAFAARGERQADCKRTFVTLGTMLNVGLVALFAAWWLLFRT